MSTRSVRNGSTQIEGMSTVLQNEKAKETENENLTAAEKSMRDEELSFYSNSQHEAGDDNIWSLLSGVAGNVYEWYDFAVYGLLAPEIGSCFFPAASAQLQLINSFGVYLAAFLMRPLGAILFGELGDRMFGRKHALVASILLITVPSVLMGMLPTYKTWGIAAPICLVILRMCQGLSVGGQLAGSYVISIEQSSSKSRGLRGSVCEASTKGGFLLASAVTTITRSILSEQQVNDWGWRVPFLFSLAMAPALYYIVGHTEESKLWEDREDGDDLDEQEVPEKKSERPAVVDLVSSPFRRRQLAGMVGVLSAVVSSFYVLFLFVPVYLSHLRGIMTEQEADLMNFFIVGVQIFFILLAGKMSDSFPHRKDLMRIGLPGIIFAAPIMFGMFESESWFGYVIAQLQFGFCLSLLQGSMAAYEVELWMSDPTLTFTGVAIGHNLAATLFGGTMPLVATYLYYHSEGWIDEENGSGWDLLWPRLVPGLYISCLGCVSLYCISYVVKHPHDVRTGAPKLQEAVDRENEKAKQKLSEKSKAKKRKQLEKKLTTGEGMYGEDAADYHPPEIS